MDEDLLREESRQPQVDVGDPTDPNEQIADREVVTIYGKDWVLQQIEGHGLKQLERKARNKKGVIDSDKFSRLLYEHIVLGMANANGDLIPGSKPAYGTLQAPVMNKLEDEILRFLGYTD